MKKATTLIMTVFCYCLISFTAKAQDVKGKNFVNAGIGLGTFNLAGTGGLPLNVSVEHGFTDEISAGIYLGYIQKKFGDSWKYRFIVTGVRGSYHVNDLLKVNNDKVDLYGGAMLYYRSFKYKYTNGEITETMKTSGGDVGIALHVGGRYMFAENIGAFAELGYGVSPLQLGLTLAL